MLEDRLGVKEGTIPGVCEDALMDSFRSSLKQRSKELPCFGSGVLSSEEWWADVVRATFRGAGVPQESMEGVFDEVFDQLFHQVFTGELAWELVPVGLRRYREGIVGVAHGLFFARLSFVFEDWGRTGKNGGWL